jgi:hypothetical protein
MCEMFLYVHCTAMGRYTDIVILSTSRLNC